MARSSSSTGSRFASANLNDLYGKQVHPGSGGGTGGGPGSKLRYGHSSHSHGGMLVLARPVRTPPGHHRSKAAPQKLTVPAPVNLPSLRKEHAGNDPSISLVGGSGTSGWKQQQSLVDDASTVADGTPGSFRSNGWGLSSQVHPMEQGPNSADGQLRPGKYTPPAARGPSESPLPIRHAPSPTSSMVLRGEDFPTLRDALPFNPVPQRQRELQQRQRERQREMKEEQQKFQQLSQNQAEKEQDWSSQLTLHPHVKQDRSPKEDGYKSKENQKPNDLSLRPGPVQYTHASNWAEDERDTSSAFRPPDWEEGPRYSSSQPPPSRTPLYRDERLNNTRRDYVYNRDPGDFGRGRDFGWERDGHFGRNDISRDWRTGAFDRSEVEMGREYNSGRDFRGSGRGQREGHVTRDSFAGRGREGYLRDDFFNRPGFTDRGRFGGRGGFDFGMDFGRLRSPGPVHGMSSHSEDAFMRDFPDLGGVDLRSRNKLKKKEEAGDIYYHDPERESFESELERVQKEQEQERQRKVEERERAIELARKEQEERERVAREEEERQRRLEEEAREAAARAEREALEAASKMEEAKKARNAEKQKMQEEEERRKENARKKLMELEERIAKREMEKKQGAPQSETADRELDAQDDRMPRPLSSSGMSRNRQESPSSRVRSPGVYGAYAVGRDTSRESERPRFPVSWRREPLDSHFPVAQDHEGHREADPYYGNFDGFSGGDVLRKERERTGEKWLANGERNSYSPRSAFTNASFLDREERWSRRGRDRPFSPPSPTYGSSFDDGVQYGRLRQSLPKQPRVPPPPMRTPLQRQASKDSQPAGLDEQPEMETQIEQEMLDKSFSEPEEDLVSGEAGEAGVSLAAEQSDKHIVEAEEMVLEGTAAVETSEEEDEALELSAVEKHVVETEPTMGEEDAFSEGLSGDLQSPKGLLSSENDILEESVDGEVSEGAQMSAELSELVDSLVVVPKVESGPVAEPQVSSAAELEVPTEEAASQGELASGLQPVRSPSADSAPLLPSPLPTMQPAPGDGKHHVFGQAAYMPPQMPLLEPRPRLQTHPDRPMTLQFGLLPGTSLFQGSVPAIQIGSIQMPLQLHPPIGHHVTHMRPPQFQFGQIAQQPPLMPSFTVHPQAIMQPLNMEGPPPMGAQPIPGHQFHLQPHPDRTFWAHQYGQPTQLQHNQQAVDARPDKAAAPLNPLQESEARQEPQHLQHSSSGSALEEHLDLATFADKDGAGKQERRRPNRRDFKASNHYVRKNSKDGKEMEAELPKHNHAHGDEDDFIEVRSKRQMLNERRGEKEKQNKSKSKFVKAKEQTTPKVKDQLLPKQKNMTKPQVASPKQPVKPESLRNFSLDAVASTVRSHQVSLSNPEVGYEKRTKSPQPLQNDSLSTDAAQVGSLSIAGAWGLTKEVVDLQIQLDEVIDSASATVKERNAATISSLLAGEKIQFGAVTMPAFVSPVGWRLGSTQPEDFLTKDDVASCDKVKPPGDAEDNLSNVVDSEAEAEAAASAIAVAAIGSDDFVHNTDQHVPSHGIIGSASKNGSPVASNGAAVRSDDPMSVSLPADLSVDPPLAPRRLPHSGQRLAPIPGGFPGMEMGTILGGPTFPFNSVGDNPGETGNASNVEQGGGRPPGPTWPGLDSFYGAPPSYTGPFINHGPPIPSIPPQTLVYTNPFGVGQFGQLYMGPLPSVKQPDWKHTPVSSGAVSGMSSTDYGRVLYAQPGNRHLGHDVISVVTPPGPFDVYRDVAFQSHWSHIPPHMHNAPGFSMQLRHPPPPFHVQQQQQQQQQQLLERSAESNLTTIKVPDQFPDELGLGDSMSPCSDAASSSVEAPPKAPSPVSALPSATNSSNTNKQVHSRAVQSTTARPTVAGYQSPAFSVPFSLPAPAPAAAAASADTGASPARRPVERRTAPGAHHHHHQQQQQQQGVAAKVWGNQGRKPGGPQGRTPGNERDKSGSPAPMSTKLKQVYVAKPSSSSSLGLTSSNETAAAAGSEIFTAEAIQT